MQGLIAADHRIELCNLACKSSDFIMVDPWEVLFLFLPCLFCKFVGKPELNRKEHLLHLQSMTCLLKCFFFSHSHLQAKQSSFQRSLTVLNRVKSFLIEGGLIPKGIQAKT